MQKSDRTMLQFDWDDVAGSTISAAMGQTDPEIVGRADYWASIALIIDHRAVIVTVDPDTDELWLNLGSIPADDDRWSPIDVLANQVGRRLGWCWIGRNYRGYLDTFTIAFDGIDPEYMLVGLASMILIKTVAPIPSA
jgi:hypothetical protein